MKQNLNSNLHSKSLRYFYCFLMVWTQTITLTGGAVDNAPQKTRDQARENTSQRLLAGYSLAELSLAELSLAELSLAELSLAEPSLAEPSLAEPSLAESSLAELSLAELSLAELS